MRRPNSCVVRSAPPTSTPNSQARWNNALSGAARLKNNVRGQLHLGHGVAVAGLQRRTLSWSEGRHQPTNPVGTTTLQQGRAQPIGGGLKRIHIGHTQKGIVGFAEAHAGAGQFLGDDWQCQQARCELQRSQQAHFARAGSQHDHSHERQRQLADLRSKQRHRLTRPQLQEVSLAPHENWQRSRIRASVAFSADRDQNVAAANSEREYLDNHAPAGGVFG